MLGPAPSAVLWISLACPAVAAVGHMIGLAQISPGFVCSPVVGFLVYTYLKARSEGREAIFISSAVKPDDASQYRLLIDSCAWVTLLMVNVGSLVHSFVQRLH